jgi:xanthine/CO dehydrogenase XdhC/CoxF family maturation factor
MSSPGATPREQSWREPDGPQRRLVLLSDNPVSRAAASIGRAVGLEVVVVEHDEGGRGTAAVAALGLTAADAVVLCDHDAPHAPEVLRAALASPTSYVAMLASRRRAEGLLADLEGEGVAGLERLHVPAGLDTGGRTPGEMALSVVAEVVADSHGRRGGPMRDRD